MILLFALVVGLVGAGVAKLLQPRAGFFQSMLLGTVGAVIGVVLGNVLRFNRLSYVLAMAVFCATIFLVCYLFARRGKSSL
jgi:uncharacterized membrane protein YeaQ/YmgE (transglycosylase-associated protein family)